MDVVADGRTNGLHAVAKQKTNFISLDWRFCSRLHFSAVETPKQSGSIFPQRHQIQESYHNKLEYQTKCNFPSDQLLCA